MAYFIGVVMIIAIVIGMIHLVSAITKDREIELVQIELEKEGLNPELENYQIIFITDVHSMNLKTLEKEVNKLNQEEIDLVLLGGDFPHREKAEGPIQVLKEIQSKDGFFGVAGNHDRVSTLKDSMDNYGMTLLLNEGIEVKEGLYIAGVEDYQEGIPDSKQAIKNAKESDCLILLSHNPDLVMEQDLTGVDLVLSGHTHGGEVTLFGKLAPALEWTKHVTAYGKKFQGGWAASKDGVSVYVSQGLGSHLFRVFARPQIIKIKLRKKS